MMRSIQESKDLRALF